MRSAPSQQRGLSPLAVFLLVGVVIVLGVSALVAGVWFGVVQLPFLTHKEFTPPEGTVGVFVTAKKIPAYTAITRDHLFDEAGAPKLVYLTPEQIERQGVLLNFNDIIGRVVKREMREGYALREKDFLPRGTRAGLVGGVPNGKRAIVLEATKLQGAYALRAGDRFDLLVSLELDTQHANQVAGRGLPAGLVGAANGNGQKKQAAVKVLARNGYVVAPVTTRQMPTTAASLTQGPSTHMKPIQEIVIAVEVQEIADVTKALAEEGQICFALRSGQPQESSSTAEVTVPSAPVTITTLEVISGSRRETKTFYGGPDHGR